MRVFYKDEWVVRYPQLREQPVQMPSKAPKPHQMMQRTLSFAEDPTSETKVLSNAKPGMTCSLTLASITDVQNEDELPSTSDKENEVERLIPASDFQVLCLDLKLGTHSSSNSAASLVSQLKKSSITNLLDVHISASIGHIDKLRLCVQDTSSKVLVTRDLNTGKSTFVNMLLQCEVMPIDQQPCTTAFCEVHDAAENQGKEELHVLKEGIVYDINDKSTYTRGAITDLEDIVAENESNQQMIELYLADTRIPSESLLNNVLLTFSSSMPQA
jgi:mitofusin